MTDKETKAFEDQVRGLAEGQGLHLVRNGDGSYSLLSAGDIPREIAGVTTLQEAYGFLTDPGRFKP